MFTSRLQDKAKGLLEVCFARKIKLATAESCTGGLLSALFTEIPNASRVFEYGFVTYANQAKNELLGVSAALIENHGAVSEEVSAAMAQGARDKAHADVAAAITGIAGPSGGTKEKPVGLVYIAVATRKNTTVEKHYFERTRGEIRLAAVEAAIDLLSRSF